MLNKNNLTQNINSQMMNMIIRLQELRAEKIDPELQQSLEEAQFLLGRLRKSIQKRVEKVKHDYAFLSRDHVFFDGDHENHSGAV